MSAPFIKFMRSDATDELMRYPNCFVLLAQIAQRARREVPAINPFGLQVGEALVGDFASLGLTRQEFRTALANLQKWLLVTTRTTNKGTIVKLCSSDVYDINSEQPNQQSTSNQPAANQPTTTNKNDKKDKKGEEGLPAAEPCPLTYQKGGKKAAAERAADEHGVLTFNADTWPGLNEPRVFASILGQLGYSQVDAEFYRLQIQATVRSKSIQATAPTLQSFIKGYLNIDRDANKLVLPRVDAYNETPTNAQKGAITGSTIPSMKSMMKPIQS